MRARTEQRRPGPRTGKRLRFNAVLAVAIATEHGAIRLQDQAEFWGVERSTWSRVVRGVQRPGSLFISAVLAAHPDEPRATFSVLFPDEDAA